MTLASKDFTPPVGGDAPLETRGVKGVLCAKCDHLNRPGSSRCSHCDSHLYIKCKDCGAHTERVHSSCQSCGRRLHRSLFEKMRARTFRHKTRITPFQVVLLLIFAAVAFYCVIMIEKFDRTPVR